MIKTMFLLIAILIFHYKSNATIYSVNFDSAINVTCQSSDTIRFYTVNWTNFQYDIYINQNIIANNLTPDINGKIYDYVAQIGDTSYALTNTNGVFVQRTLTVNNAQSIQNIDSNNLIKVFPNPAQNQIAIESEIIYNDNLKIVLSDLTGKNIQINRSNSKETILFLNNIDNGLYFIKIFDKDHLILTEKLIINK